MVDMSHGLHCLFVSLLVCMWTEKNNLNLLTRKFQTAKSCSKYL